MITIFVGKDGRPSMKNVYARMKSMGRILVRRIPPGRKPYLRIYEKGNIERYTKAPIAEMQLKGQKVIRWGNRIEAETASDTIVYNKSEAIANATDKKLSRELFIKNKVRCPLLVTPSSKDIIYPVIARPARHAKGRNFVVLENLKDFTAHYNRHSSTGWYYSNFVDKEREFRVHCAHGKVLAVMEKAKGGDKIAWNRAVTGEPFSRVPQSEYMRPVVFQACKAVKTLGLDFAGVDVLLMGKEAYVLEVNTSPTLNSSDHVSDQYAKYFDWLNRSEKRRPHWEFEKFEKAISFAWKNFQLLDEKNPKE